MYFIFVSYIMYHIHVECCIKISYCFCILAFVLYFTYICWKRKKLFHVLYFEKAKIFSGISSWHIFIIYMELRHFCLHAGTKDSWILRHSFLSIDQASTCPTVGARCYHLFVPYLGYLGSHRLTDLFKVWFQCISWSVYLSSQYGLATFLFE